MAHYIREPEPAAAEIRIETSILQRLRPPARERKKAMNGSVTSVLK
ncbi:MAG: hypothetical protein FWG26_00455 [Betaproteobacteria bacterium]|nr:hypothetical protein [Betaproteobacteria bacterium]